MSTWFHHLLPTDDDPADGSDTDSAINDDARDKAQAAEFRQHATDDDKDTTLILVDPDNPDEAIRRVTDELRTWREQIAERNLAVDNDFAQLAALRKLLDKDDV